MRASAEWDSIENHIKLIILKHQISLPIAVGSIAKDLGIKVLKSTMPGSISGEIREENNIVTIKVNRHDAKERQRFTVAHEIAHFLLHRDRIASGIVDDVLYRSRLSDTLEKEANRLAADIIMPIRLIEARLNSLREIPLDDRVKKLAEDAEVSLAAMQIRIGR